MRMRDIRPDMFTKKSGITCVQVARILQQYLDEELDASRRAMVAGHLSACRRCGLDEKSFREIKSALARRRHEIPVEPIDRLRKFAAGLASPGAPYEGEGTTK
jgi:anti-sigma factor RsiW